MTIQLSVTIWTMICFVALMLILRFLLFEPVLKVLDERRARIEKAAQKKTEKEMLENEYASMLAKKEKDFLEAQQKELAEELESIRVHSKKAIEEAKEERIRNTEAYRVRAREEQKEILDQLSRHTEKLASAFADRLIKE